MLHIASPEIGYTACRVILGVLFFFQAYDKIFKIGLSQVTATFSQPMESTPRPLLYASVFLTSYIELIGGALLILGFLTTPSLWMLSLDMILVCIGFSLIKPLWDMQHFFPRLILLLILLLVPITYNKLSLDHCLDITF